MKQSIGYFLAGIVLMLWVTERFCKPGSGTSSRDTLIVHHETVMDSVHLITATRDFHYYHESRIEVPVLTPEQKDSVLVDHFSSRLYDTTLFLENNYREHLTWRIEENELKNFFRDFQNLRPTALNETTVLSSARTRFSLGGSLGLGTDQELGRTQLDILASLQWPSDNQALAGYDPFNKRLRVGALFKISLRKKRTPASN